VWPVKKSLMPVFVLNIPPIAIIIDYKPNVFHYHAMGTLKNNVLAHAAIQKKRMYFRILYIFRYAQPNAKPTTIKKFVPTPLIANGIKAINYASILSQ